MSYKEKQSFGVRIKVRIVDRPPFNFIIVKSCIKKKDEQKKKKNISHHRISTVLLNPHHPLRLNTELNFRESMEFLFGFLTYNDANHVLC